MEDTSFLELLFSKNSIAGFWAVIGAFIALIGVFTNNFWENGRKKKDRKHTLIRDTYYGAVEYINYNTYKIMSVGQTGKAETDSNGIIASEKFAKLFLTASPAVIDAFTKLSLRFADILMKLTESAVVVQGCACRIQLHQQAIDSALKVMDIVNVDMKEYNEKNINIQNLWDSFVERFEQAQSDFKEHSFQLKVEQRLEFELKMKLLKQCLELLLTTYTDTYDAIFLMRSDLDSKLNKRDSKKIKRSIEFLEQQLKASLTSHVDRLKLSIIQMEKEIDAV